MFLKALSDLWTIALLKLREAHGLCDPGGLPVVFSTREAVEVLRALCAKDENLKRALFQEPFGFGERGAIERAFTQAFGDGAYTRWRDAFEGEQFNRCYAVMEGPGQNQNGAVGPGQVRR